MSTIAEKEPSFKNFLELPQELRMMINDEMREDDRCRFSGASTLCNFEAKLSKNYIEFINFTFHSENEIRIRDRHGESKSGSYTSYFLEFKKEGESQYMAYKRADGTWKMEGIEIKYTRLEKELWKEELSNSTTLVEHAVAHFKKLLQTYQKTIRKLSLTSEIIGDGINFDAEVTNLKNLEELKIDGNFNGLQFLMKTKRPLKKLNIWRDGNNEFPLEKVIHVQNSLCLPNLKLNNEQFLQLSATNIETNIGQLTAEDVYRFIRSWQKGEVRREMKNIYWFMDGSSFDTKNLFCLFGDQTYRNDRRYRDHRIFLKHQKEAGKEIKLLRLGNSLQICFFNRETADQRTT